MIEEHTTRDALKEENDVDVKLTKIKYIIDVSSGEKIQQREDGATE